MYGAIYGDLVGSIYEFNQTKGITSINPEALITKDSFYSDDTILTIAILDAILNNKDYDTYLRKYAYEYKDYHPNYNSCFDTTFSRSFLRWSQSDSFGESHGNGAMMRISPVGFMFNNSKDVIKNARLATIPSHNSNEAIDSATIIALMIYYFRKGLSKEEVFRLMELDINYVPFTKFNRTCEETIGNCLYSFYNSNGFEDAIRKTLLMGGDTDTNCCIVGGLAEALYGINKDIKEQVNEKIPQEFVKVLKKASYY